MREAVASAPVFAWILRVADTVYVADYDTSIWRFAAQGAGPAQRVASSVTAAYLASQPPWIAWLDIPWARGADGGGALRRFDGTLAAPVALDEASMLTVGNDAYWFYENRARQLIAIDANDPSSTKHVVAQFDSSVIVASAVGIVVEPTRVFVGLGLGASMTIFEVSFCTGVIKRRVTEDGPEYAHLAADDDALHWGAYGGFVKRLAK